MTTMLEQHWFDKLGGQPDDLQEGKVTVRAHGTLAGYAGATAFKRNNACIISVPKNIVEDVEKKVAGAACQDVFKPVYLEKLFGSNVEMSIGPAWQAQIDMEHFKPCHGADSRLITVADEPAMKRFLQNCSTTNVDLNGLKSGRLQTVGVFVGEEIVAVSGYELRDDTIAHIAVLCRPDYRGKGYAKKAASHMTSITLAKKMGIQYQTLMSNPSSIALARGLGYTDFAETITVRFKKG
jgi:hypothetical protein